MKKLSQTTVSEVMFKKEFYQQFEIIDLAQLYTNNKQTITKIHRADFYHIIWFRKGNTVHFVDFEEIKIEPETILVLNKNVIHCFSDNENVEGTVILFTDRFFSKSKEDAEYLQSNFLFHSLFSISRISLCKQKDVFIQFLDLMTQEVSFHNDSFQSEILRNHLHNTLLIIERGMQGEEKKLFKSKALKDAYMFSSLLENNFKSEKTVHYYAKEINITEKKLIQSTLLITGKTPKDLIINRVVLEAQRQIVFTNKSIKEIAYDLGYDEPTNFIKFFRKQCETTPLDFRNKFS